MVEPSSVCITIDANVAAGDFVVSLEQVKVPKVTGSRQIAANRVYIDTKAKTVCHHRRLSDGFKLVICRSELAL